MPTDLRRLAVTGMLLALLAGCKDSPSATLQGYVEGEYLRLAAPLAGKLEQISVQRGDNVSAKQALFTLDAVKEQAAVAEANARLSQAKAQAADLDTGKRPSEIATVQAGLESAQASLKAAEAELARQQKLVAQHYLPAANLDTYKAQRDTAAAKVREFQAQINTAQLAGRDQTRLAAQASIKAAEAALAQAQWQLDQKAVTAPQNGMVDDTYYRTGEWVAAGSPVLSILPPENRKVRFFIPEPQLGSLQTGQGVQVSCDGCGEPIRMKISYIAPQAEYTPPVIYSKDSREKLVVMVEAIPNAADASRLKVGQPVDVALEAGNKP
ncbi:MAG: HlyD family efflux transporter periplasmic adaptor subunit [Thiothrix sp.]|uniref:HlyD family secretion protein n=1 Tax=Thiothrix sp. TaxID=1032 RepID=UPI002612C489|nr:HlyD family efflux transporter periplasmic adaptor subunit [Thiothrix sp.]MDD5392843.1 HlyD family efflux transporter periplasmic adaptor subunit [Thiothrix sp.]